MEPFRHAFVAMASANEVQVCTPDPVVAHRACMLAEREVARIEAKFSRYRDDSIVTRINRSAGGPPVAVDEETAALLAYADACWQQSDGLFDITSGILRRAWNFRGGALPGAEQVAQWLPHVGWQRVRRSPAAVALEAGMEIDFGGIGKEYAADRAAAAAQAAGAHSGLVNLGGDVRVIGPRPDGQPWRVGIAHPRRPGTMLAQIALQEGGLASSGDYERFIEIDGRRYCHILDPRTGWPVATAPQSVSVVAPVCTAAGSCATIAMLKAGDASAFLRTTTLPYLLVDATGGVSGSLGAPAAA